MSLFDPYLPQFQAASQATGVPVPILEAVGYQESHFNAGALGTSGEQGLMQLMPPIQSAYGVTNPFDPAQSIMGGAQLLAADFGATGNWSQALSMYNSGSPSGSPSYASSVMNLAQALGFAGSPGTAPGTTAGGTSTPAAGSSTGGHSGILGPFQDWLDGIAGSVMWVIVGVLIFVVGLYALAKDSGYAPTVAAVPVGV